jgi:hypothetical protein
VTGAPRASKLQCNADEGLHSRCLTVLASTPHDNIRGTGLGLEVLLVDVVALCGFLEERHSSGRHAAHVATSVGGYQAEQALASLLGEVGLFENTLGGVDVGQIESGSGVARIKDCCKAHTRLERPHPVHFCQ